MSKLLILFVGSFFLFFAASGANACGVSYSYSDGLIDQGVETHVLAGVGIISFTHVPGDFGDCYDSFWVVDEYVNNQLVSTNTYHSPTINIPSPQLGRYLQVSSSPHWGHILRIYPHGKPETVVTELEACIVGKQKYFFVGESIRNDGGSSDYAEFYGIGSVSGNSGPVPSVSGPGALLFVASTPGNYTAKIRARIGRSPGVLSDVEVTKEFSCSNRASLNVSSVDLAQASFGADKLIDGKPVVARIKVNIKNAQGVYAGLVPIKGVLSNGESPDKELVGCIDLSKVDLLQHEGEFFLYSRNADTNWSLKKGNFKVEINPESGVFGVPKWAGCGGAEENIIPFSPYSDSFEKDPIEYDVVSSPKLNLVNLYVFPYCYGRPSCTGQYNNPSTDAAWKLQSDKMITAMLPINPTANFFKSERPAEFIVRGEGGSVARRRQKEKRERMCEAIRRPDHRRECYAQQVFSFDLNATRAAGRKVDKSKFAKYLGRVSNDGANQNGYFSWISKLTGSQVIGELGGVTSANVPDTLLAIDREPLITTHELVHAYGFEGHEDSGDLFDSYWVDLAKDMDELGTVGNFNDPLRAYQQQRRSLMFSVQSTGVLWPQLQGLWMDTVHYNKLIKKMPKPAATVKMDGDEFLLSGALSESGDFEVFEMFESLEPGQNVGDADDTLTAKIFNFLGEQVGSVSVPVSFKFNAPGSGTGEISSSIAPISMGLPKIPNGLKVVITSSKGGRKEFFPDIEILRTSVSRLPEDAFRGSADSAVDRLLSILDAVESDLAQNRLFEASSRINGQFGAALIAEVRKNSSKDSPLDTNFNEVMGAVVSVKNRIDIAASVSPAFSDEFIRLSPASLVVPVNERAEISVIEINRGLNPELGFFVEATLDDEDQRVSKVGGGWKISTSRLSAGGHQVKARLIQYNVRSSKKLVESLMNLKREKFDLSEELNLTTDPEIKDEITKKVAKINDSIQALLGRLEGDSEPLGSGVQFSITAE